MKRLTFSIILLLLLTTTIMGQEFRSSMEDFEKMASYLSAGSGKWMTPNENYDPKNPSSHKALGLWFEHRLKGNLLHLSIIAYRGDTAHVSSEAMWFWHPGEQRIKYYDLNIRGIFAEGETYFTDEKTFVTRNFTYLSDGSVSFARGQNFILTEKEHETASLRYEKGEWVEQARFKWRLTEKGEGYRVVKKY